MSKVPKAPKIKEGIIPQAKRPSFTTSQNGLTFSFAAFEETEYFNLDGTCENWASDLFNMMKEVSKHNKSELIRNDFRKYRVHNHEKAKPPSQLPQGVELKDCYQIRISKSKGGIHGVFIENVFYVIWLDPLHNMYPDDRFGGLRKVKASSTCCKDRDNEILELQDKIKKLEDENKTFKELFDDL